jgi:hypothetical protein
MRNVLVILALVGTVSRQDEAIRTRLNDLVEEPVRSMPKPE